MDFQSTIAVAVAIFMFVIIAYFVNKKTPSQIERLKKQKLIDLGLNDIPEEDLTIIDKRKIELLQELADNTSSIKSILVFFVVITIISFIIAFVGIAGLSSSPY